jgi:hypothetical protein
MMQCFLKGLTELVWISSYGDFLMWPWRNSPPFGSPSLHFATHLCFGLSHGLFLSSYFVLQPKFCVHRLFILHITCAAHLSQRILVLFTKETCIFSFYEIYILVKRFLIKFVRPIVFPAALSFKWAPRHEGVLGDWRYSSTHSWPRH